MTIYLLRQNSLPTKEGITVHDSGRKARLKKTICGSTLASTKEQLNSSWGTITMVNPDLKALSTLRRIVAQGSLLHGIIVTESFTYN